VSWLFVTLIATMAFALTSVFDNYYINRIFRRHLFSSIFYGHLLKAIVIFVVFVIVIRSGFPLSLLPFFLLIALTEIVYLLPYYKSLQIADTSVVAALYSLGRVFVPIVAFFTIGETLSFPQYTGFFIIIVCSALLTLNHQERKLTFNKSFLYMGIATLLLAIQAVSYKYIFEKVAWHIGYSWAFIFIGLATLSLLLFNKQRRTIVSDFRNFKKYSLVVMSNVFLSLFAWAGVTYAISFTDVSLVKGVEASEPFFVMLYAVFFKKQFPDLFKEETDEKSMFKKTLLFVMLAVGIILVAT
jgi:drug/metabolite transporter (DMT)-like permease